LGYGYGYRFTVRDRHCSNYVVFLPSIRGREAETEADGLERRDARNQTFRRVSLISPVPFGKFGMVTWGEGLLFGG